MTNLPAFSNYVAHLREFIAASGSRRRVEADIGADAQNSASLPLRLQDRFNELALELFALQFEQNEPYRRFCEFRYVNPRMIARWSEIPVMPTSAFKELELTCLPSDARTRVFYSSGTTRENRSWHFHNAETLAVYEASLLPCFCRHLLPEGESMRFATLTPAAKYAPNSSLVHMFETIRREFGSLDSAFVGTAAVDGGWDIDLDRAINILRDASAANRPVALLGTAFNFVQLLDELKSKKLPLKLPQGSRVLETGGYKGRTREVPKVELHEMIEKYLGIPRANIVNEYGMSELSSQAYDAVVGQAGTGTRVFRFPPWARVQIISAETGKEMAEGETGLVRVFDLANVGSVLVVQTEDLGVRRGEGFELLGRAVAAEARGCSLMSP